MSETVRTYLQNYRTIPIIMEEKKKKKKKKKNCSGKTRRGGSQVTARSLHRVDYLQAIVHTLTDQRKMDIPRPVDEG